MRTETGLFHGFHDKSHDYSIWAVDSFLCSTVCCTGTLYHSHYVQTIFLETVRNTKKVCDRSVVLG